MTAMADGILYQNDFEAQSVGTEWSNFTRLESHENFTRFNGRYSYNDGVTLFLDAPPDRGGDSDNGNGGGDNGDGDNGNGGGGGGGNQYNLYTVNFDLYIIDTWDGNGTPGPDALEVRIGANPIFHETFTNLSWMTQSFRSPDVGPAPLGYDPLWGDSIYRDISVDFTLPENANRIVLTWQSLGLQGLNDESWGIDNVSVNYRTVPAPATLVPLAGLLGLGRRRRR